MCDLKAMLKKASWVCLVSLLLPGCLVTPVKDTSKFYALGMHSPFLNESTLQQQGEILTEQPIKIDFQVTSLPSYLRKSPLMIQLSEHEVRFDEFHRWAEPVEEGLIRIIVPLLREAALKAYAQRQQTSSSTGSEPSESSSPKLLKVKLSLKEMKVDISRQNILFKGGVTLSFKQKDASFYRNAVKGLSYHLEYSREISDIKTGPNFSWEKVITAMEMLLKEVGNRMAELCFQYVTQN
jgi:uncharacterized lipoprotein YmbA